MGPPPHPHYDSIATGNVDKFPHAHVQFMCVIVCMCIWVACVHVCVHMNEYLCAYIVHVCYTLNIYGIYVHVIHLVSVCVVGEACVHCV